MANNTGNVFQRQPDAACSFAVAGGAITAGTQKGNCMSAVRTAAGVYTCTMLGVAIDDTDLMGGACGSYVGAVGAILDFVSTSDTVKVVRFFDNAGAAIEPITVRIWFSKLILS